MTIAPHMKNDGHHAHSAKNTVETAAAPTNSTGVEPMSNTTQPTAPAGFKPEYDYSAREDGTFVVHDHEAPLFWMGPGICEPGLDVYLEWTTNHGVRVFTGDGIEIQQQDLLKYAVQLLKLFDAATAAHH